jgi:hypothetical protein
MGDLDRQEAVEQAGGGCVLTMLALALITAAVVALAYSSVATPILASLLILGGLAALARAERA